MSEYLLDHGNQIQQYRYPRRVRTPGKPQLSGMVGVHTAEGVMDDVGIDTGAENVAAFIVRRADYGSYHVIVDSDSSVHMAPDDYETWHIGADAHNWHSWGISAACRTTDWDPDHWWTQRTIVRMGAEIAAFWQRNGFDPAELADRWLTREQALNQEPGLIEHGVAQPADRTDAWDRLPSGAQHPHKATLRRMLSAAIKAAAQPDPIPTPPFQEDDMLSPKIAHHKGQGDAWYVVWLTPENLPAYKYHLPTDETVVYWNDRVQDLGVQDLLLDACPTLGT